MECATDTDYRRAVGCFLSRRIGKCGRRVSLTNACFFVCFARRLARIALTSMLVYLESISDKAGLSLQLWQNIPTYYITDLHVGQISLALFVLSSVRVPCKMVAADGISWSTSRAVGWNVILTVDVSANHKYSKYYGRSNICQAFQLQNSLFCGWISQL